MPPRKRAAEQGGSGFMQRPRGAAMPIVTVLALSVFATSAVCAEPASTRAMPTTFEEEKPTACAAKAVSAIQSRYRETFDLRARFRQATHSVAFGTQGGSQPSEGTVQFAKPGKMRWSYERPTPSLVLSNGDVLWLYDPEKREAQRLALSGGQEYFSAAGVRFLLGDGDILREFHTTHDDCSGDSFELELVPRSAATYEKLQVRVDPGTGDLVQTRIVDLLGNVTVVDFSEIEVNRDPDPSVFEFDPPPGIRVIELGLP